MSSLPRGIISGVFLSSAGRVFGTAVSVASTAIITRALSAAGGGVASFGAYSSVLAAVAFVNIVADGGVYLAATKQISLANADKKNIYGNALRIRMVLSLGASAAALLLTWILPFSAEIKTGMAIGVLGGFFQLVSQLMMGIFQKEIKMAPPVAADVAGRLVQLLAVIAAARFSPNVAGFVGAFAAGAFITLILSVYYARRHVDFPLLGSFRRDTARAIIAEGFPIGVLLILSLIFFKIDTLMLAALKGKTDAGIYSLPYKALESVLFFPAALGGLMMPLITAALASGRREAGKIAKKAADIYLIVSLPASFLFFAAAPIVVEILGGREYAVSAGVMRILAAAVVPLFLGNLFGNAIIAAGRQRKLLWAYLFLALFNVGLNFLLIPPFSYNGAASATFLTELLSAALAGAIAYRGGLAVIGTARTIKICLSGAAMCSAFLFASDPLKLSVLGIVIYGGALLLTGAAEVRRTV